MALYCTSHGFDGCMGNQPGCNVPDLTRWASSKPPPWHGTMDHVFVPCLRWGYPQPKESRND